jgi:hypothetical protein
MSFIDNTNIAFSDTRIGKQKGSHVSVRGMPLMQWRTRGLDNMLSGTRRTERSETKENDGIGIQLEFIIATGGGSFLACFEARGCSFPILSTNTSHPI